MSIRYALFGTPANVDELVDYAGKKELPVSLEISEWMDGDDPWFLTYGARLIFRSGSKKVKTRQVEGDYSNTRFLGAVTGADRTRAKLILRAIALAEEIRGKGVRVTVEGKLEDLMKEKCLKKFANG